MFFHPDTYGQQNYIERKTNDQTIAGMEKQSDFFAMNNFTVQNFPNEKMTVDKIHMAKVMSAAPNIESSSQ